MSRYIDADNFERACMFDRNCEGMQDVIYKLRDYPSADVVEVRHGKWSHDYVKDGVEYNDWFDLHCSVCGETQRDAWGKWNYCPYCGAKMDEEEEEIRLESND